jgi:uncharacterized surface protein with fasciclin (FAS1) repeats
MTEALSSKDAALTVLAPVDAAFAKIDADARTSLLADPEALSKVISGPSTHLVCR